MNNRFVGKPKERDHLRYAEADERIIIE